MFNTTPAMDRTIESMFIAFDTSGMIGQIRKIQFAAQITDLMVENHADENEYFQVVRTVFLDNIRPVLGTTEFHRLGPAACGPVEAFVNRVAAAKTPNIISLTA